MFPCVDLVTHPFFIRRSMKSSWIFASGPDRFVSFGSHKGLPPIFNPYLLWCQMAISDAIHHQFQMDFVLFWRTTVELLILKNHISGLNYENGVVLHLNCDLPKSNKVNLSHYFWIPRA